MRLGGQDTASRPYCAVEECALLFRERPSRFGGSICWRLWWLRGWGSGSRGSMAETSSRVGKCGNEEIKDRGMPRGRAT